MGEIENLFDSLYFRFVLRDIFGKIVPGLTLLSAIAISFTSPTSIITFIASMSFWIWIITFGWAWITGFAIQGFAEIRFIKYYPEMKDHDIKPYFIDLIKFKKCATLGEKQLLERTMVILEACGNGYVALFISLLLISMSSILNAIYNGDFTYRWMITKFTDFGYVFIVILAIIYYLRKMHSYQVQRRQQIIDIVFNNEIKQDDNDSKNPK